LRLEPSFRYALYAAFAVLFITGAGWLVADQLKEAANGEGWQTAAAYLLMIHGGAAMATLLLLGALVPLHMRRGWRAGRNRITGTAMVTFNAALILTAFGLYYLGSETLRPWASELHIGFGILFPVLLLVHIVVGRRSA
jgi:predicted small integral membrane protein